MKKYLSLLLVVIMVVTLTACGSNKKESNETNSNKDASSMTEEDINTEIYRSAMTLTSIWNDYIVNIRDYSEKGTDSIGQEVDIEFLIDNFKESYAKLEETKNFVNSLDSKHDKFKNAFNKSMEQLDIIYKGATSELPKANEKLSYRNNIDLFKQYFDVVYEYALDNY